MPNICPVYDLRNNEYKDLEKTNASLQLMNELQKGKVSGETKGWLFEEDVAKHFEEKFNK